MKVSWCPQYEAVVKKALRESEKPSIATQRMQQIRQEPEAPETLQELEKRVQEYVAEHLSKSDAEAGCSHITPHYEEPKLNQMEPKPNEELDESGIGKTLPEDSFDESVVVEDDMFDIYKEPEDNEFGHKKYQPEYITVNVSQETKKEDYLSECLKLKEDILKRKNEPETIESLVEALDKTHVNVESKEVTQTEIGSGDAPATLTELDDTAGNNAVGSSVHIHKHLLASIGKHG